MEIKFLGGNSMMKKYVAEGHTHYLSDIVDFALRDEQQKAIRTSVLYDFVNYIESSGNCYIDTGFIPNQDTRIIAKFQHTADSDNEFLFGVRSSVSSNSFCFSNYTSGKYRTHYYKTYLDFDVEFNNDFIIDKNKNITTIGDNESVIEHDYAAFTCPLPLYLFCVNTNGTKENYSQAKLYFMKIYDNDVLVRDFVPVYHVFREVYGLYDKVNDVFYTNKGSGTFAGA